MPELPEVEISRQQLERWAGGHELVAVHVHDPAVIRGELSSRPSAALPGGADRLRALVGRRAGAPVRHGKRLGWLFGDRGFVAHYGMSGYWSRSAPGEDPPPLARLGLEFDRVTTWYVDARRFGCVVPVEAGSLPGLLVGDCGPDALDAALDGPQLRVRVGCRKGLKAALMEQDRLAGLGNIHAAEACFRARVSPWLRADSLTDAQWRSLSEAIRAQLRDTVLAEDGTDELRYVNLGGPNPFSVYDREGEPCPRCGAPIAAGEQAGRTTYWCPSCQPGPATVDGSRPAD
jgi:formamidopyrimidine-DNA glycosylase